MSINDLILEQVLAEQRQYEEFERSVGGPEMVKILRLHSEMQEAADRLGPFAPAAEDFGLPFSGRELLLQAIKRMEAEATGVHALRNALGAVDGHFGLLEFHRQAELESLGAIAREKLAFERSFGEAIRSISTALPVDALWREVSKVAEPWVSVNDPYRSFEAFGALSELAAIHRPTADDDIDIDLRIDELPAASVRPLGRAAGLVIHEVQSHADLGSQRNVGILLVGTGTWMNEASIQIQSVEVMLRLRLDAHMTRQLGAQWHKHRVNNVVLESWRSRQSAARVGQSANLIDFATFGELRDVLIRSDVWPAVAADVRMTKEEFRVVLDQLMEIRHAVSHSRTLSRRHFIWCFAGVDRILQAFGIDAPPGP